MKYKFIAIGLLIATNVNAENLKETYLLAKQQDPTYLKAKSSFLARKQELPKAVALSLPTISASALANKNYVSGGTNYDSGTYQIKISQPIINPSNIVTISKAVSIVERAKADLVKAEHDLIIRAADKYFDALKSKNNLEYVKAQYEAFEEQYKQTNKKFKLGVSTKTDALEAKAKRDETLAELISSKARLKDRLDDLSIITGKNISSIVELKKSLKTLPPSPNKVSVWIKQGMEANPDLISKKYAIEEFRALVRKEATGHFPTLSLDGSVSRAKATSEVPYTTTKTIGVNLSVPIFSGGSVSASTQEAAYNLNSTKHEYMKKFRETEANIKKSFRAITTSINEIKALKQAVKSTESSYKATNAAYKQGKRNITDVLDAKTELLRTKRNLKDAKYEYLLKSLQLKADSGSLSQKDLEDISNIIV